MIPERSQMLFFRYSNYKNHSFIAEHQSIITQKGFVWMMKIGKRTSSDRLNTIIESGGYLILKSPVKEGNTYYICHISDFRDAKPDSGAYLPGYYKDLEKDDLFWDLPTQYLKIDSIKLLPNGLEQHLVLQKNKKLIPNVITETRTAVMYIENDIQFNVDI